MHLGSTGFGPGDRNPRRDDGFAFHLLVLVIIKSSYCFPAPITLNKYVVFAQSYHPLLNIVPQSSRYLELESSPAPGPRWTVLALLVHGLLLGSAVPPLTHVDRWVSCRIYHAERRTKTIQRRGLRFPACLEMAMTTISVSLLLSSRLYGRENGFDDESSSPCFKPSRDLFRPMRHERLVDGTMSGTACLYCHAPRTRLTLGLYSSCSSPACGTTAASVPLILRIHMQ